MKTYQTKYTDRHGKKKLCSTWYLTFNDRAGTRRRLKAYTNKNESSKLGIEIETVMANNGQLKTDADKKWFTDLLPRIQSKLTEWNVVNNHSTTDHLTTPLSDHLKVFLESRKAKACKQQHISKTESVISRVLVGCGFKMFTDIDGPTVETFLAKGRGDDGYGEGTYNAYLTAVKTFTRWLSDERGLTPDPLARTKPIKQTTCRKTRRALNKDELDRLLTATRDGERRGNMTAEARYLVLRIASECGLRYSEIKSLRVLSFNLDANPCTVHVEAADSKGKRADDLILNDATAAEIKTFLAGREPTAPAFALPANSHAAQMLRADLKSAGIEYTDAAGRDCDFHSLRHSFITNLFLAGVPATIVQKLARHKDLKTTLRYSHVSYESEVAAIQKLRDLPLSGLNTNCVDTPVDTGRIKNVGLQANIAVSA